MKKVHASGLLCGVNHENTPDRLRWRFPRNAFDVHRPSYPGADMNPHALEALYHRMGRPAYFWPCVMFVLFIVLPLLASAVENV
jgi:hypothetical protein